MPSTLQGKALEQIHECHQGVEKCMLKAWESVFWPWISDDIWETVEKCGICQSNSRASRPVGNISEIPPHPWHTLATNLFYWNRLNFIVVGDYFTKYLIVRKLPNSSTHVVIKELGMIFRDFGWPFVLRSDNGPCYSSREFQQFLEFYQVHHTTSSPHHPQSNGFAEALVGISKKLMEKSIKDGKPWNYGLLQYHVIPISSTIQSPLEALTGRKTEDFNSSDPFDHWEVCEKFQDAPGTHQTSTSIQYFHQQLQHGTQTRTACFYQGSTWKHLEDRNHQPTSQGARFLLSKVSRWIHPEKDLPVDQTQIITFSVQVGDWEQKEEHVRIQTLQQPKEFPNNVPRHGTASLTERQSSCTSIPWTRGINWEAEHCYQFLQFLWCDTTFHPSEEVQPFNQRCSSKKIFSIQDINCFVWWNLVELSGRCFVLNSNQPGLIISFLSVNYVDTTHIV